jgi:hypothetical protein
VLGWVRDWSLVKFREWSLLREELELTYVRVGANFGEEWELT